MNTKYRKTIIAGNWKMNMLSSDVKPFIEELKPLMPKIKSCETVLCVPAVNVAAMLKAGKEAKIMTGAQDVSKFEKGAYTGEVSASQLEDIGVKYCIVGHSERRQYHGEDDLLINAKTRALIEHGINPIICVGESLEQREMELTMAHINYQVRAALSGVDAASLRRCEQAEEVCREIRAIIRDMYGARAARGVSILYGGSMNAKNAAELLAQPDVDGGLIGGASLKPNDFATIIAATGEANE